MTPSVNGPPQPQNPQIKPISVDVKVPFLGKKKASAYAVLQMTKRLAMFKAGLGVNRMIQVLAEQETDLPLKQALEDVQERLKAGEPFSKAFGRHPEVFSVLYVSMLRVGETAGAMGQVLNHLSEFLEQDHKVVEKFKSAMTYPMFIFGTGMVVVGGLFTFVLPPLLATCVDMAGGHPLPLPTIILMGFMSGIKNPLVQVGVIGGLIWAISAYRIAYQTPQGRYNIDRSFPRCPWLATSTGNCLSLASAAPGASWRRRASASRRRSTSWRISSTTRSSAVKW